MMCRPILDLLLLLFCLILIFVIYYMSVLKEVAQNEGCGHLYDRCLKIVHSTYYNYTYIYNNYKYISGRSSCYDLFRACTWVDNRFF